MNSLAISPRLASLTSLLSLALGALTLLATTGCAMDTHADVGDEAVDEAEGALGGPPPASCLDIRAATPGAPNGNYVLHIGHDPAKPWTAYCHNMATSPAEYLSLQNLGPGANFSQYTTGGAVSGTDVRTRYSKVRIDPATLLVDISDQTFSISSGQLVHGGETVSSMPFGVAMSCDATDSGVGNIDLTGTPFAVATDELEVGGAGSSGSSTYSANNRVVALTGGGYCGWICASPDAFNPFNDAGDFQLNLVYAP